MSQSRNSSPNLRAGGTIQPATFVKVTTTDDTGVAAGSNDKVIGISGVGTKDPPGVTGSGTYHAQSGDGVELLGIGDIGLLLAGSGGWTAGDFLVSDASGQGITAPTSGSPANVGAIALETTAASSYGRVQVVIFQMLPTTSDTFGPIIVSSTSANALAVGANGTTNPSLQVDASTASAATGLKVTSAAAAAGVAVAAISSGTNENLTVDAKGSGTITLASVSTGNVVIGPTGKLVMAGTLTAGGLLTNAVQIATSGPLIYSGSGAPSISAAVKGSLYLRSDGSSTSTRAYIASDTAGTWTAITTAA